MRMDRRTWIASGGLAVVALSGFGLSRRAGASEQYPVRFSDAEWRKRLTPDQFATLRRAATEPPFSSPLLKEKRAGLFTCAGCALPLYASKTKYDSHTGWPSFWQALPKAVATKTDFAIGFPRVEVHCRRCGGHLGHLFDDGPRPTGKRHCINGDSLGFVPTKA